MLEHKAPDMSKIPGGWEDNSKLNILGTETINHHIKIINPAISQHDVTKIINYFSQSKNWQEVSVQGMVPNGKYNDNKGSLRTTLFNPILANQIFENFIEDKIPRKILTTPYTYTDCWQDVPEDNHIWELVGMSPMLRYMVYEKDGQHFPHYDAGYFYEDGIHRTLKSVVIYLTTNKTGATRFIDDKQQHLMTKERNHDDWSRAANDTEVFKSCLPKAGNILIFDHRLCHDVSPFIPDNPDEKRIIIRGDLIYKLKK